MKKIFFNNRYGLTESVLNGRKTMTRRIIGQADKIDSYFAHDDRLIGDVHYFSMYAGTVKSTYHIGEEVAVAQSYKDCWDIYQQRWEAKNDTSDWHTPDAILGDQVDTVKGWTNKMFVRADPMPHRILITNIRVERLQEISDEDCVREGVMEGEFMNTWDRYYFDVWGDVPNHITFRTPRAAFAALIDRISGRGKWEMNPWVFVYEFELVK